MLSTGPHRAGGFAASGSSRWRLITQDSRLSVPAIVCPPHLLEYFFRDRAPLIRQHDLAPPRIKGMRFNRHEAKTRGAISRPVTDFVEISRHRGTVNPYGPGVGADALAFIKGNHEKCRHTRQRHGRTHIRERLKRP
jgi:hypothetical protein